MNKLRLSLLLTSLMLTASILGFFNFFGKISLCSAQVGTQVGGILWDNTTWTLTNSPYTVTNTVQIPSNVSLTIQAGVIVISNVPVYTNRDNGYGNMFLINGVIVAHGTADKKIVFDGNGKANFFSSAGSNASAFADLDYCIIRNGSSFWWDGHGHFNLTRSELSDLSFESYVWYPERDVYIMYNKFTDSSGFSIGHRDANVYIEYNLFDRKNPGFTYANDLIENWASYDLSRTVVCHNSFVNMNGVVLKLPSGYNSAAMNASQNYWGTNDTSVISSMIYDKNDDITCAGFIPYLPILQSPDPSTPKSDPLPTIPEFASLLILPLFITMTLLARLAIKRGKSKY